MIVPLIYAIGIAAVVKPIFNIIMSVYHHFKTLNLKSTYGEGWAVVTGATDGIGFGFCQELAAQGYNICLISRNSKKIQAKIKQLKSQFGDKIQYKGIKADFKQSYEQQFFERIFKQLQTIKPVILVNNVGYAQVVKTQDLQTQQIKDLISVNCLPMAVLTSYFLRRWKKQDLKAGIVNISSYSCASPIPFLAVYSGTKAFNDCFSRSCFRENKKIDILSVRAMLVESGSSKKQKSLTVPTSRQCASDSLKYLGHTDQTSGHIKHQILSSILDFLPRFVVNMIAVKQANKVYEDYAKKKN